MATVKGPTKGVFVLSCPEKAESVVMKAEPLEVDSSDYEDVLSGTTFNATVVEDADGVLYLTFSMP